MTVIVQKRRTSGYAIPLGGEILWFGIASLIPEGWGVDAFAASVFIRGAAEGQATNTPASSATHSHANPPITGSDPDHTHPTGGGSSGDASGSTGFFNSGTDGTAGQGHSHGVPTGNSGAGGVHSHGLSGTVSVEVYPSYSRMYWIKASAEVSVPVGGIIMWDRPLANIPDGFLICDGGNGTPDLRDKFIYGAAIDGDIGVVGGSDTHVHGNSNTGAAGTHAHSLGGESGNSGENQNGSGFQGVQVSAPHTHSIDTSADADSNHTHAIGNTEAGTTLPVYLKLYFIMRTI